MSGKIKLFGLSCVWQIFLDDWQWTNIKHGEDRYVYIGPLLMIWWKE